MKKYYSNQSCQIFVITEIKEYSQTQQYSRRVKDKTNSYLSRYECEYENVKCKKKKNNQRGKSPRVQTSIKA